MRNPSNNTRFGRGARFQPMPLAVVARPMNANDPSTNILGRLFTRHPLVGVCIQRIRKKGDGDFPEKLIETFHGVGYRIKVNT